MIKLTDTFRGGKNASKISILQILWFVDRASRYYRVKKNQLDAHIIT